MKIVDPDGLEGQLVVGGPTASNVFGHVALAHDGKVYSYGTFYVDSDGDWGVPLDQYLKAQENSRETAVVTLDLTDQQDADLKTSLEGSSPSTEAEYSILSHSCVTECEKHLQNAGALTNEPGEVTVDRAGNEMQAGAPSSRTPINLVGQVIDQGLVRSVQSGGKKVSALRAVAGTIKSFFQRLVQ